MKNNYEKQATKLEILMYVFLLGAVGLVIANFIWLGVASVVVAMVLMFFTYKISKKGDELNNENEMNEREKETNNKTEETLHKV